MKHHSVADFVDSEHSALVQLADMAALVKRRRLSFPREADPRLEAVMEELSGLAKRGGTGAGVRAQVGSSFLLMVQGRSPRAVSTPARQWVRDRFPRRRREQAPPHGAFHGR